MKNLYFLGLGRGRVRRGILKSNLVIKRIKSRERSLVGSWVVASGDFGEDIFKVENIFLAKENDESSALGKVERRINKEDLQRIERIKKIEEEAEKFVLEKIKEHGLKMKLVKVLLSFDEKKLTFYFTAPERVDFRTIVRDLAGRFKKMIRMQQINSREYAQIFSGIGPCGRVLCCSIFLRDLRSPQERIKKEVAGDRKRNKCLGVCGKAFCCMKFDE